jgi:hypothetical protein
MWWHKPWFMTYILEVNFVVLSILFKTDVVLDHNLTMV